MKGSTSSGFFITVLLIAILLTALSLIAVLEAFSNSQRKETIVLSSIELIKTSNTFALVGKTLQNSWTVASIQSVFRAGDEAFGCGYEGGRPAGFKEGYWLQADLASEKSNEAFSGQDLYERLLPKGIYGPGNPMTCIPSTEQATSYLKTKLQLSLPEKFESNGLQVKIDSPQHTIALTDAGIEGAIKHIIEVSPAGDCGSNACSYGPFESKFVVETEMKRMRLAAELATKGLVMLSVKFIPVLSTQNNDLYDDGNVIYHDAWNQQLIGRPVTQTSTDYLNRFTGLGEGSILDNLFIQTEKAVLKKSRMNVNYRKGPELVVPVDNGILPSGSGLYLHYDANVKITESDVQFQPASPGSLVWPTTSRILTSCYGDRSGGNNPPASPAFHGGVDVGGKRNDPVYAAAKGIVDVIKGTQRYTGECSGGGGRCIRIRHEFGTETYYTWYMHLESINDNLQIGNEVGPGTEIGKVGSSGAESGVHLHFEIRDSTDGVDFGTVNPCVLYPDDCRQSIAVGRTCIPQSKTMTGSTSVKIPAIVSAPIFPGAKYFYLDETKKEFVKKPFTLEFNAEDYLPAIDCTKDIPGYLDAVSQDEVNLQRVLQYRFYFWDNDDRPDIICYRGCLYTCNLDSLPGMAESTCTQGSSGEPAGFQRMKRSGDEIGEQYKCGDEVPKLR